MKSGSFFRLSYTGNWARITCSRARMESHDAISPKPTASRAVNQRQIEIHSKGFRIGAGRGSRTPKTRRSADFESAASASSAIPAFGGRFVFPLYGRGWE